MWSPQRPASRTAFESARCGAVRLTRLSAALLIAATLHSQNRGQAEVAFQGYYVGGSSQPVDSITGTAVRFQSFLPDIGLLSGCFEGYSAQNGLQTGENVVELRGAPWIGYHWTATAGDFRAPGSLIESPFNNIFMPEIEARGVRIRAEHQDTEYTFYAGEETLSAGPRVAYRILAPQTVIGASALRRVGENLLIGGRFMEFSSSQQAIADNPNLFPAGLNFSGVSIASMQALYTPLKRLKLYGELSRSRESNITSSVAGFAWETRSLVVRANYIAQGPFYFPLVGYFTGDRRGPFGEVRLRPWAPLEFYGSASQYRNNLENNANATSLRSSSVSAGLNAHLPWKFSFNGQISLVDLSSRAPGSAAAPSDNQELNATLSRSIGHHSLQVNWRDLKLAAPSFLQRQRSTEILDTYQVGHFFLGGAARLQQAAGSGQGDTVYIRGSVQGNAGRFNFFANLDYGNDLANSTVFATNTYATTVVGFGMKLLRDWNLHAEAFRNRLAIDLNPESIFVLEGTGTPVSQNLAVLNQWNVYFSLTRSLRWGGGLPAESTDQFVANAVPLVGTVEGVVRARTLSGAALAAGIPITLDGHRTVTTGSDGHYLFSEVPEGQHELSLSATELPADFDPGEPAKSYLVVQARRVARADFEVRPLSAIEGRVTGPEGVVLDGILIRLLPSTRYTLTTPKGRFAFYNLREGDFDLAIDTGTLPANSKLLSAPSVRVAVRVGTSIPSTTFSIGIVVREKTIRKVLEKEYTGDVSSTGDSPPPAPIHPGDGRSTFELRSTQAASPVRLGRDRRPVTQPFRKVEKAGNRRVADFRPPAGLSSTSRPRRAALHERGKRPPRRRSRPAGTRRRSAGE